MKIKAIYILVGLLMLSTSVSAKKVKTVPKMTQEEVLREQQFTYYMYAAQCALDANRYDDALAYSEFAYRLRPNDPTICQYLGFLYEATGRADRAETMFKVAYEGDPDAYWYRYFSLLYHSKDSKKHKQALAIIKKESKRQTENSDVLNTYFQICCNEGDAKQALKVLDRIEKKDGKTAYNALRRYQLLSSTGYDKEGCAVIDNYLQEDPDNYYMQVFRGDIWQTMGKDSMALATYESIRRDYPGNPYVYPALSKYYQSHGEPLKAREVLGEQIEISPDAEALEQYFKLLIADTTVSLSEQQDFIQKAYLLMPESAMWHYYWALVLAQREQMEEAINICNEGLRLKNVDNDSRFSMHVIKADAYMRLNQVDSCFASYERALEIMPDNAYVLNNYAYFLAIHGGDLKKAEKMSQKAIEKEPTNATYLDTYAWILHLEGEDTMARFFMRRAMNNMRPEDNNEELIEHNRIINNE